MNKNDETQIQKSFWNFINETDYISLEQYNSFKEELEADGNLDTLIYTINRGTKFIHVKVEDPEMDGYFKVKFLGKIKNPALNWVGYITTGTYFSYQLKCVLYFGMDISSSFQDKDEKPGFTTIVIGLILGLFIRLPIGILLTIIQLIVVSSQKKN